MTLTTKEFVRRYQLHILPKGFTRIRHYGFLGSSWKKDRLPLLQLQLADRDLIHVETFEVREKSLHRVCPSCKKGTLITLLTFDSRGPPQNYKKIIKRKLLKFRSMHPINYIFRIIIFVINFEVFIKPLNYC